MQIKKHQALTPELLREVKRLHFQTRRLADQGVVGRYRSAFRGTGMEFEEVREYFPGDDIRSIDWKVTARSRKPFVKSYREERELTVMVAIDVSASTLTGTRGALRAAQIARAGAVLSLIALTNNDKVGLVTYSDRLESYHPPRKARSAVWRILHEVLAEIPSGQRQTDLAGLCSLLSNVLKRRAIIFVLSDFIADGYEVALGTLARRHDVNAVVVADPADYELPDSGLTRIYDPESGETRLVDLGDTKLRADYRNLARERAKARDDIFRRHGVGTLSLQTDKPFMDELRRYFDRRSRPRRLPRAHRPV
ncbi:MAG: DUF58 domain-containing protein [Bdellovibrionota bacterium]